MVFGQLVMPVQCCAGARRRAAGAPAQHCTGMTNWPNTIQCLGSDDIMSLGIKPCATEGVGTTNFSRNSRWISGFTMDFWIHDGPLDSAWISGLPMDFWIHDGFLDSRWISGFAMDSWIHYGFLDSGWIPGFKMDSLIHDGFLEAPRV